MGYILSRFSPQAMILPPFSLSGSDATTYTNERMSTGRWVLFVYPKDDTPGCTLEAKEFRDTKPEFDALGITLLGLSKDSLSSHAKFCEKYSLPFPLISDPEKHLLTALGAIKEKSMFGKKYMGVARTTYLIENGSIVHTWNNVKPAGHAGSVLDICRERYA